MFLCTVRNHLDLQLLRVILMELVMTLLRVLVSTPSLIEVWLFMDNLYNNTLPFTMLVFMNNS